MRILVTIVVLLLIIMGAAFAVLNASAVTINLYWHQSTLPMALLLAIVFVLGALIALVTCLYIIIKQKTKLFHSKRELEKFKKKYSNITESDED